MIKIGKLELLKISNGIIITDKSYEMSDSVECIFIPKESFKELIKYLED